MSATEFTVDRATWYRGRGARGSQLLRSEDGTRCCLGFYGAACGVPDAAMLDVGVPLRSISTAWPAWSRAPGYTWAVDGPPIQRVLDTNDDPHISDEERERRLTDLFASQGVRVTFVGEGRP